MSGLLIASYAYVIIYIYTIFILYIVYGLNLTSGLLLRMEREARALYIDMWEKGQDIPRKAKLCVTHTTEMVESLCLRVRRETSTAQNSCVKRQMAAR